MRILLDTERCQGHGRCYSLAPDLFDSDDLGHCVLLVDEVPAGAEADARSGVDNCPEQALSIAE
ncbi:MAG TPA: ferredoxin [Acidimicrobiaceae bacterium]|nr:ferredoxin [Acidimicrobiaceae bacterium]